MQLIGSSEQHQIDQAWQAGTGLPLLLLMEAAATAVYRFCVTVADARKQDRHPPVLVLCGRGQNGGDAYACARLLIAAGWPVRCCTLFSGADLPDEAKMNRNALERLGVKLQPPAASDFQNLQDGLILDGIFGSGFLVERGVPEVFRQVSQWVSEARSRNNKVIAIDMPSGVASDSGQADPAAIKADWTVTFVRPKIGLISAPGCFFAGEVHTDPIGIPAALVQSVLDQTDQAPVYQLDRTVTPDWCPIRPPDAHKGLFGRLLLVGGTDTMPGAVALAAESAARSGLGLLQLAVPRQIRDSLLAACPEALQLPLGQTDEIPAGLTDAVQSADAVAIGPGIGRPVWLAGLLRLLISTARNLVIDADALNEISREPDAFWALAAQRRRDQLPPPVLTPHPGEFHRLAPDLDLADRLHAAAGLAARSSCAVVLKGAATVIALPGGPYWINTSGQDGLARGGSGDILTGMVGALLAQHLLPEQAACTAVFCHGLAADLAAAERGRRAMLPRDLLTRLGSAWYEAGWEVNHV